MLIVFKKIYYFPSQNFVIFYFYSLYPPTSMFQNVDFFFFNQILLSYFRFLRICYDLTMISVYIHFVERSWMKEFFFFVNFFVCLLSVARPIQEKFCISLTLHKITIKLLPCVCWVCWCHWLLHYIIYHQIRVH